MRKALFVGTGMLQWNIFLVATKAFSISCSKGASNWEHGGNLHPAPSSISDLLLLGLLASKEEGDCIPTYSPNLPHHQPLWMTDKRQIGDLIAFLAAALAPPQLKKAGGRNRYSVAMLIHTATYLSTQETHTQYTHAFIHSSCMPTQT